MAYIDQAALSTDAGFGRRLAACAAVEVDTEQYPPSWASDHQWEVAASPGFADAYASAVAAGIPDPGVDPAVISDAMILSAVQTLFSPP